VFTGTEVKSIDNKGRLVVPSKFRRNSGFDGEEGFFITPGPGPYLIMFPAREFHRLTGKATRALPKSGDVFDARRSLFPETEFLPIDKQGRVVLPPAHVAEAELGSEVAILGMGNHIEIWDVTHWKEYRREKLSRRDQDLWRSFLSPE
jgi:MraZ protein